MSDVTYVFKNGQTYAIHEGKVVASSSDPDDVQRQVKQAFGQQDRFDPDAGSAGAYLPDDPGNSLPYEPIGQGPICPDCGAPDDGSSPVCPNCGAPLQQDHGHPGLGHPHDQPSPGLELGGEAGPYMAKITTPNGLKGTVLGKVAGLWGDEVTVRLENGRIVKLPVGTELRTQKVAASTRQNPIERLSARLAASPDGTRESLVARSEELTVIQRHASTLIREGASWSDQQKLDELVVTAEVEKNEIVDAVAHLDAQDPITGPRFSIGAAKEAAGISREDGSWLDHTLDEMIKEAEAIDFTKLMDEGPEAFTAELADVALADTSVTQQMASSFIGEKTAGIARDIAEPYMATFLERVEECRTAELTSRTQPIHKEAAADEDKYKDLPDDALFL